MNGPQKKILHFGLGRFHRGHQAVYYQKMKDLGFSSWDIVSMSMRSPEARDQLRNVHLKYPVVELTADSCNVIWVDVIRDVLYAQEDRQQLKAIFEDSRFEIVTLTITEKGYHLAGDGMLDLSNPQIIHDLKNPDHPQSAIGLLASGLRVRRLAGKGPLTIISCDNLRDNGRKLEAALKKFLDQAGLHEDLLWVTQKIKFPNTMVDRIVPSLLPEKISSLENKFSLPDGSEVIGTEKFCQWVIEDNFALERPDWDKAGVQFVSDVRPFEEMKLKLLNAAHSYLAYAGLNRGYQFVHEAINDETLRKNVIGLFNEVRPLLDIPSGFDLEKYQASLLTRFENNHLPHQLKQIAMDGSQKLPQRIFPSLIETEQKKLPNETLCTVVEEWLRTCAHLLEKNILPDDPEKALLLSAYKSGHWFNEMWKSRIFHTLREVPGLKDKIGQV